MDPIDILMHEHRIIEKALEILETILLRIRKGERVSIGDLECLIDFFKTFADKCHHGKEEKRLFPYLESKGIPRDEGPIGVMLTEHEKGRSYIKEMSEAIGEMAKNDRGDSKKKFIDAASRYITLLKEHIYKEDNILFQLGRRMISEDETKHLIRDFEEAEKELGEGVHEKFEKLINDLAEKYIKRGY